MTIPFDPLDPYPLLEGDSWAYNDEQEHSERVDAWLGLRIRETEQAIASVQSSNQDEELWIDLPPQALLTPYSEIRRILALAAPPPGALAVDLGAAYGRMGFVLARHFPEVDFLGYELVEARVREGRRVLEARGCSRARLLHEDLARADFRLPEAALYFLYDFGSRRAIDKTLEDLRLLARAREITVVGRGRRSRDAIERDHPWLSQVRPPEQHGRFTIYRS